MSLTVEEVKTAGQQLEQNYDTFRKKINEERLAAVMFALASIFSGGIAFAKAILTGEPARDTMIVCVVLLAIAIAVGVVLLVLSLRRTPLAIEQLRGFVEDFVRTTTELAERPTKGELLKSQAVGVREFEYLRTATAMDDERKTRQWLSHFIEAMASTTPACFSFQSIAVHEHMSTHQMQVIAMQVRLCMGQQYDPVFDKLHDFESNAVARMLHVTSVNNLRDVAEKTGRYVKGHLLSSRINVKPGSTPARDPGLTRLVFWTESELTSVPAQQYVDVWESFGIPVFWLERTDRTCRKLAELIMSRDENSRIRAMFKQTGLKPNTVTAANWPENLDFFIAGEKVLLGYEETNGELNWDAGAEDFYDFVTDAITALRSDIYYAKEVAWQRHASGSLLSRDRLGGFVLLYDFVNTAKDRLAAIAPTRPVTAPTAPPPPSVPPHVPPAA